MSLTTKSIYGQIPDILRESKDQQCRGILARPNLTGGVSFCALGTIFHRAGISSTRLMFNTFDKKEAFAKLGVQYSKMPMKCPKCEARRTMFGLLAHLNDTHNMKYGEIADNLEIAQPYDESVSRWQKFKNIVLS